MNKSTYRANHDNLNPCPNNQPRGIIMKKLTLLFIVVMLAASGCATMDQQSKTTKGATYGAAGGAAAGAIVGQIIGKDTKGTLIGAAAGAAIGGLAGAGVGRMMDNQEADRKSTRLNSSHSQQSRMPSSA